MYWERDGDRDGGLGMITDRILMAEVDDLKGVWWFYINLGYKNQQTAAQSIDHTLSCHNLQK
jgi:hypothetical protein